MPEQNLTIDYDGDLDGVAAVPVPMDVEDAVWLHATLCEIRDAGEHVPERFLALIAKLEDYV